TVIGAGRPGTLRAIEAATKSDGRLIFAVSQRENVDQVTPGVLYTMGTIARVGQVQRGLNGVQILLHGERRATAVHYTETEGYLHAVVRDAPDLPPLNERDAAFVALYREVRERAAELGQKTGLPDEVVKQVLEGVTDAGRLADLVAGHVEMKPSERQGVLETLAVAERVRPLPGAQQRQIGRIQGPAETKAQEREEPGERPTENM